MTAKKQALRDIMEDLRKDGKCFLAFRSELNPIMDKLVEQYLEQQNSNL